MKKRILSAVLSLALVLALSLGLFTCFVSSAATTETKYGKAEEMATGVYSIVVPNVAPTGMAGGPYYVDHATAVNPGFLFKAFDESNHDDAAVWKITKVSDTECTIQNEAKGAQGYVNMSADYIGYGAKKNIKYEQSGDKFRFYVEDNGQKWFIRFTNSNRNESRFQSGTGEASHEFWLYGTVTTVVEEPAPELEIPPVTGEPLLTLACISDLHADYGLQNTAPYVRNSVVKTIGRIAMTEDADILLVGGDITSDNGGTSDKGGWTYETFRNVINEYKRLAASATTDGYSLWAAGNHDFQAGEDEGYDSYADFMTLMEEANGKPLSVYRQKDDKTLKNVLYPDFVLGYHYNIKNFDFIVINAPWGRSMQYSSGTYSWLSKELQSIGRDRTVFLLTHYPLTDSRNISTPTYGTSGEHYSALTKVLKNYPNVVMLYGHNHGGSDNVYINDDTFERITSYTKAGRPVNDRNVVPTSFITSFMGSMSYYNNSYNPGGLTWDDPKIVQALMVYVYADRIVFQTRNYGSTFANVTPKSWTIMRDIEGSLNGEVTLPEGDLEAEFLVTTDVTDKVKYDSSQSIGNKTFSGSAVLQSYATTLTANTLPANGALTTKQLTMGIYYENLKTALTPVVNTFEAHNLAVKDGSKELTVEGDVMVTMPAPVDAFGPYTPQMDLVVYYVDDAGQLCMTDIQRHEDGKTVSFLLPKLTPFAFSVRANVVDASPVPGNPDNTDGGANGDASSDVAATEGSSLALILILVGAGCALVGVGVVVFIVINMKKASAQKKE